MQSSAGRGGGAAEAHTLSPPLPAATTTSGWRFNGAGACTSIPQIGDAKAHATATASPRACLPMFPTRVKGGLLFAWLESGAEAEAEAAARLVRACGGCGQGGG